MEHTVSEGAFFNISKIHKNVEQHLNNIKNHTAHPHGMVHVPAMFRENTAMCVGVTVRNLTVPCDSIMNHFRKHSVSRMLYPNSHSKLKCSHFLYDFHHNKLTIHQISCFYDNLNNLATNRSTIDQIRSDQRGDTYRGNIWTAGVPCPWHCSFCNICDIPHGTYCDAWSRLTSKEMR